MGSLILDGMAIDLHFPPDLETLRAVWLRFATEECGTYTPLYRTICEAVAEHREVLQLTADGPSHARQPNLLLAAAHYLVLRRRSRGASLGDTEPNQTLDELGSIYEAGRGDDAGQAFIAAVLANRSEIVSLLETRFTQTNECGRSAPLALALHAIASANADTAGRRATLALIDAGCSAGLNLGVDRYRVDFGASGACGPEDGTTVSSELTGPNAAKTLPLPDALDCLGWRIGLERAPVDLDDDAAIDWLLACIWPEHGYRLERAVAGFAALRADPPTIVQGDMVDDLSAVIDQAPNDMLVTVLTSWAVAYLRPVDRKRFVEVLHAASMTRPIVWLSMEAPGVVQGLDLPDFVIDSPTSPSLVGSLRFDRGKVEATTLGWTHPHGAWFAPV